MDTHLNEWLHFAPLSESFAPHTLRHLSRIPFDSSDNGVGVGALLGALIQLLNDDNLLSRLTSLEDDGDLCKTMSTTQFKRICVALTLPGLYTKRDISVSLKDTANSTAHL